MDYDLIMPAGLSILFMVGGIAICLAGLALGHTIKHFTHRDNWLTRALG